MYFIFVAATEMSARTRQDSQLVMAKKIFAVGYFFILAFKIFSCLETCAFNALKRIIALACSLS